jgi:predicted AlkP superfamily pyrophosphatase or phosphodiesterase
VAAAKLKEMGQTRRIFCKSAVAGVLGSLPGAAQFSPRHYPGLLVLIVAEQFRADYLDRVHRSLSPGGFRRLMDEGAWFPDCRHAASTFTSTGVATVATGAWPQLHGIVADAWYDRAAGEPVPAGPGTLLATTLASQIAAAPRKRVFISGMDPAPAALLQGTAQSNGFFTSPQGEFLARGEAPRWLVEYNRLNPIENLYNAPWLAIGAPPGTPPLRVLAWDGARPEDFYALYRSSPFAQSRQFEFARELIVNEGLGRGETRDFLGIVLGPLGQLGYEVGADSPLVDQLVLHLDRQIEFTLDSLNKSPGSGNYALAFTAAHGAPPAPEAEHRERMAVSGEALAHAIDRALSDRYDRPAGRTLWVEKYVYPFLWLRRDALARRDPRELRAAAGRAALAHPAVAGYFTADGDSSHGGEWQRRFRNSFHAVRSGDVMLSYRPGYIEEFGAGRGVSYGSLYNYDIRVPLFLYGPQFRPGVFEEPIEAINVAPTLARLAGVAFPSSSTGRVLGEALAERATTQ